MNDDNVQNMNDALLEYANNIDEGLNVRQASIDIVERHIDELQGLIDLYDFNKNDIVDIEDEFSSMVLRHLNKVKVMYVEMLNNVRNLKVED